MYLCETFGVTPKMICVEFEREKLISEDELERGQKDLQDLTDKHVEQINSIGKQKETEIMQV